MASVDALNAMSIGGQLQAQAATPEKAGLEKEQFLKLLVAQISHQDPLNPQDSDQYMQQLTQFSTVEQLMNLNQGVDNLAVGQVSANSQSALRFVGKDVVAAGDEVELDGINQPTVDFSVADPTVGEVEVNVFNEAGDVVYTQRVQVPPGGHGSFTWNGQDPEGQRAADGRYHVSFKAGTDSEPIPVDTYVHGRVTGVRFDQGYPELMVGDRRLRLSDIIEVTGEE